jgi:hypothetical protein
MAVNDEQFTGNIFIQHKLYFISVITHHTRRVQTKHLAKVSHTAKEKGVQEIDGTRYEIQSAF